MDSSEKYNFLIRTIEEAAQSVLREKPVPKHPRGSKEIKKLHKRKLKYSKKILSTRSPSKMQNLKRKIMVIEAELAENKDGHIKKVEKEVTSQLKTNLKAFYRYARK